ncbi:MAG: hypothetical protein PGN30_10270 [Mycolicibacterium neoaurum]|uniref:hypothetical protein n=1 Tax=Mycolicibacterium neoaurum TaxID=1795 RepID=UPI002FF5F8A1
MFERSTMDARNDEPTHLCVAGTGCRDAKMVEGQRIPVETTKPDALCQSCEASVRKAIDDMPAIWVALHMAVGDQSRRAGQKVSGSRAAPINVNTDIDALKSDITKWMVAAANPIYEQLNSSTPQPRNNTDLEHARIVSTCADTIGIHLEKLMAATEIDVTVWMSAAETPYPGESILCADEDGYTYYQTNTKIVRHTGNQIALKIRSIHRDARSILALNNPVDKLSLPCPHCNEYELVRSHRTITHLSGRTEEIDRLDCAACNLNWPYARYQHLIHIWVKEDEMEREKLQEELAVEKRRREVAEWLLAKREWQLNLALQCPDVSAAEFAHTIVNSDPEPGEELMTDKDIAALIGVSDSTVRVWATRGRITRHPGDDGAVLFNAREVWDYAMTAAGGRNATARRLNQRRTAATPA